MLTAKRFGMKVTRYFVGFGPTLWSFRRGETEYGLKAIPLGGFCKIVGMTPQDDDVAPEDEPRAMWRYPVWKRTVVMGAGSVTHFMLGFAALWFAAMFVGLPNPALPQGQLSQPPVVTVEPCVVATPEVRDCAATDPAGPARLAGLRDGDRIVSINGTPILDWQRAVEVIRPLPVGVPATVVVERDGAQQALSVAPAAAQRPTDDGAGTQTVAALGVGLDDTIPYSVTYGPVDSVGASVGFTGDAFVKTLEAMKRFPEKVPRLWAALAGEPRDVDTPISVVGASRLGGEAVANDAWEILVFLFITLNFFVGVFNLLPLLPLDGGHIAIAWFERVRTWLYARFNKPDPGRVDYYKLMPVTYAVILIFGAFTLLTVTADVVNPITLFSR
jgi:membrane-associated protease RseP (regulator of RpoE activity)